MNSYTTKLSKAAREELADQINYYGSKKTMTNMLDQCIRYLVIDSEIDPIIWETIRKDFEILFDLRDLLRANEKN